MFCFHLIKAKSPGLIFRNCELNVEMIETCQLCGRTGHGTKSLVDQCRLFTAILGRGWGVSRHLGEEESMSDTEEDEEMFITPNTSFSEE